MTSLPGTSVKANASVDEITLSPNGRNCSSMALEPVAITTCSARMTCSPISVSTSTVLPSRNRAQPSTTFTPARFSSPETPLFSRPTMPSFQSIVFARSSSGRLTEMPSGLAPDPIRAIFSNCSAAWISALDGMQPILRPGPPSFFASTSTVSTPSCPARIAQTYPPGPAPITNNLQNMSFIASAFHEDQRGRLKQSLDSLHEARRIEAIYDAMIKTRGQIHHLEGNEG